MSDCHWSIDVERRPVAGNMMVMDKKPNILFRTVSFFPNGYQVYSGPWKREAPAIQHALWSVLELDRTPPWVEIKVENGPWQRFIDFTPIKKFEATIRRVYRWPNETENYEEYDA